MRGVAFEQLAVENRIQPVDVGVQAGDRLVAAAALVAQT